MTEAEQYKLEIVPIYAFPNRRLFTSKMELTIPTPVTFNFQRTVISHGWYGLLPFEFERDKWKLTRVLDRAGKTPITVVITGKKRAVKVTTESTLGKKEAEKVLKDVRHMLRLDDNLEQFYSNM